jgi:hypothetical protein
LRGRRFAEALARSFGVDASRLTQVLSGRSERELILRTARSAQPEAAESQDALEMGKQHFDALSLATGSFEGLCAGERTGNIAGIFMNAARDFARRLLRTASHLVRAGVAIRFARPIQHLIVIHDVPVVVRVLNAGQM